MNVLIMAAKGCDQMTANEIYFSDKWFNGLKTANDDMAGGVDYCGPIKTIQKGVLLDT